MRKSCLFLIFASLLSIQTVFAVDASDSKPCRTVAKACMDAGYHGRGTDSSGKGFWMDCMKPVILGKTVAKVTVDANTVKACRTDKINKLKQELQDLGSAK